MFKFKPNLTDYAKPNRPCQLSLWGKPKSLATKTCEFWQNINDSFHQRPYNKNSELTTPEVKGACSDNAVRLVAFSSILITTD